MTVLRATARTLLASYFVSSGIKALRNPAPLVPAAEPIASKVVPLVKKYAPAQVVAYVPEDTVTLVRVNGALQLAGGLALATGKGRRLGALLLAASLVPSTLGKYPFWSETDPEAKAAARTHFAKNVSLLGGVLLAAGDTEGRPSLAYRAQKTSAAIARDTKRTAKKANKKLAKATGKSGSISTTVDELGKTAGEVGETVADAAEDFSHKVGGLAEGLLAGGAAAIAAAAASTRKSRKQAVKQLKKSRGEASKQFAQLQKAAAKQAKTGGKATRKQFEVAKKQGLKRLEAAQKEAGLQFKAAQKQARTVGKNIHLGEN